MSRFSFLFLLISIGTLSASFGQPLQNTSDCTFTREFYGETYDKLNKLESDVSREGELITRKFVRDLLGHFNSCLSVLPERQFPGCDFHHLRSEEARIDMEIANWLLDDYRGNVRKHLESNEIESITKTKNTFLAQHAMLLKRCFRDPYVNQIVISQDDFFTTSQLFSLLENEFLPRDSITRIAVGRGRDAESVKTLTLNDTLVTYDEPEDRITLHTADKTVSLSTHGCAIIDYTTPGPRSPVLYEELVKKGCEALDIGTVEDSEHRIGFKVCTDNPGPIHYCTLGNCTQTRSLSSRDVKTKCEVY